MERNRAMSDSKMTNDCAIFTPADLSQVEGTVVQALDARTMSDVDAESKLRAKLEEFAAELQTIKTIQDLL
jgi:hypothetical protein